jgi:carbohydrate diacid regulator
MAAETQKKGGLPMLNATFAQAFVEKIKRKLDLNVNIMNEQGIIIASSSAERIGSFHSLAYEILQKRIPEQITEQLNSSMIGVTSPGVNLLLLEDNKWPIGVVGVSGTSDELLQIARTIKFALETEIEHQKPQRYESGLAHYRFDALTEVLLERPIISSRVLAEAKKLELDCLRPRLCVLCRVMETAGGYFQALAGAFEAAGALPLLLDAQHMLLIFEMKDAMLPDYPEQLASILDAAQARAAQSGAVQYYIGTPQKDLVSCGYCCDLLRELEKTLPPSAGRYCRLRDGLLFVLHRAYDFDLWSILYEQTRRNLQDGMDMEMFVSTASALVLSDMHLEQAAKLLYIHKNTLSLRLRKIRELLGLQPVGSMHDGVFLTGLLRYIQSF